MQSHTQLTALRIWVHSSKKVINVLILCKEMQRGNLVEQQALRVSWTGYIVIYQQYFSNSKS